MTSLSTAVAGLIGTVACLALAVPALAQGADDARVTPFAQTNFGNQRRTFVDALNPATFSELLASVKGGLHIQVIPGFMLAPTAGVVMHLENDGRTRAFAELEVNHTFKTGGYAGTGIGVWNLGAGDRVATTVLIHFGAPLVTYERGRARLLFTYESRLFFGQLNNIDNNYQALVGFRYVFR